MWESWLGNCCIKNRPDPAAKATPRVLTPSPAASAASCGNAQGEVARAGRAPLAPRQTPSLPSLLRRPCFPPGTEMHEATRRVLGVLLRHLDGFDSTNKRTVVIGATNRKQVGWGADSTSLPVWC